MATVKKILVFVSCILSGLAVIISATSLFTQHWIQADKLLSKTNKDYYNTVYYGLFEGTLTTRIGSSVAYPITMTCLANENVCAYLCAQSTDARYTLLKDLYNNKTDINGIDCPSISVNTRYYRVTPVAADPRLGNSSGKKFINCGVWVCTILFLTLSIFFGAVSSAMSMYNTVSNPVQVYFSLYGVYLYNAVALFCVIMTLLMWGVLYNKSIYHDVAIFYTLYGQIESDKVAQLGYSYWLNLAPMVLYISSICILYLRQYLISKDPGRKIVERDDDGDPRIYLY